MYALKSRRERQRGLRYNGMTCVLESGICICVQLYTFLERELVVPPGLEVVQRYEQLGVVLLVVC